MAHNFRLTGNLYVSKAGNDNNDGLTPNTPKLTFSAAFQALTDNKQTIVIGTGMYEEAPNLTSPYYGTIILADGNVKFRGNGSNNFYISVYPNGGPGGFGNIHDVTWENYANVYLDQGIQHYGCIFYNIGNMPYLNDSTFDHCKFINAGKVTIANTRCGGYQNSYGIKLNYCIIINTDIEVLTCYNTYFNSSSVYRMQSPNQANYGANDYNNVMGQIAVNGCAYIIYANLAAYRVDYPNGNVHSINASPLFNDSAKLDFTLQYNSPHINAATDGISNIGGTAYAVESDMFTDAHWKAAGGAVISMSDGSTPDLIIQAQDYVLAAGKTSGTITSAPLKISVNSVLIQQINYNGLLAFNKVQSGGTVTNNNVPDANVFAGNDTGGGGNPDRLSYEMRWTENSTQPASDTDWTNNALLSAGAYTKFEINAQPLVDVNGKGTGSASFNPASAYAINAIWVQVRLTLTNAYL